MSMGRSELVGFRSEIDPIWGGHGEISSYDADNNFISFGLDNEFFSFYKNLLIDQKSILLLFQKFSNASHIYSKNGLHEKQKDKLFIFKVYFH